MKDFKGYCEKLQKGLSEKLFFLEYININEYQIIIDFGCANGLVSKALLELGFLGQIVGVENNPQFYNGLDRISSQNDNFTYQKDFDVEIIKNRKSLLILSSVLHEITENFIYNVFFSFNTVVIRDMIEPKNPLKNLVAPDFLMEHKYRHLFLDMLEQDYGKQENKQVITKRLLFHFLLKYHYAENWETEVKENYFNTKWDLIVTIGKNYFTKIMINDYTLEFIKNKVAKEMNFVMTERTHRQMILSKS